MLMHKMSACKTSLNVNNQIMEIVIHLHAVMWSSFDMILTCRPQWHWKQPLTVPMHCSDQTQSWEAVSLKNAFLGWREAGFLWIWTMCSLLGWAESPQENSSPLKLLWLHDNSSTVWNTEVVNKPGNVELEISYKEVKWENSQVLIFVPLPKCFQKCSWSHHPCHCSQCHYPT